jgi:hypothetical protein
MTKGDQGMRREREACREREEQIVLHAARELDGCERAKIEEHLQDCVGCATALEAERELLKAFAELRGEENGIDLVAGCRARLDDALDEEEEAKERRGILGWMKSLAPRSWKELQPGLMAAALVLVGFSAGMLVPRWIGKTAGTTNQTSIGEGSAAGLRQSDLKTAGVAGIQWTPSEDETPPQVSVELNAQNPVKMQGTVNNEDIKQVLLYVLDNNERFPPDVRLDAVELLKPRLGDPDVIKAMTRVIQTDSNPAVRLKAVDALDGARASDEGVRQALLVALGDGNPGVRIEAVNELQRLAIGGDLGGPAAVEALRERMQNDPNNYVRLQSAALVRELARASQEANSGRQKY